MKKYNLKLTVSMVSLFISIVLCFFSNTNKYCLFFCLIFLAVALIFFSFYKLQDVDKRLKSLHDKIDNDIDEEDGEENFYAQINSAKKEKRKLLISFNFFAILLIIIAFILL